MKSIILAVALTAATVSLAVAQIAAPSAVDVERTLAQVAMPYLIEILSTLLTIGLGWVAYQLKAKWNIDIDKQHQDTLQKWLMNQASSLAADGSITIAIGPNGLPMVKADQAKLMEHAQQYAQQIPDAVAAFGLNAQTLAAKITDKLPQVPAVAAMMAAPAK